MLVALGWFCWRAGRQLFPGSPVPWWLLLSAAVGVLEFETAGSLQRAGRRGFAPAASQRISGELRLPAGPGPFPAIVLAHVATARITLLLPSPPLPAETQNAAFSFPFTRIVEHKHFENPECENTVVSREYSVDWRETKDPYYPMGDERNGELYRKYRELADKEKNVLISGRLGSYKYLDMDDTISMALKAAEKHLV